MYCENCGNELNVDNVCLCDNCGCKNTEHYGINDIKKAVKYINVFLIVISSIILILLGLSIYGYIKSEKMADSFEEIADFFSDYRRAKDIYGIENEGADLYTGFKRLSVHSSIVHIHYKKCIKFFGIAFLLLIIFGIIANRIYRKKIAINEKYTQINDTEFQNDVDDCMDNHGY